VVYCVEPALILCDCTRAGLLPFLVSLLLAYPRDEHIVMDAATVLKNFAFASDAARSACAKAEAATAVVYGLAQSVPRSISQL
jgi:hypothetical protein